MHKEVKSYLTEIGRKGGKAGKGSPRRREANRRTALARFRKLHPPPPDIESRLEGGIEQDAAYEPLDGQDYRDQE